MITIKVKNIDETFKEVKDKVTKLSHEELGEIVDNILVDLKEATPKDTGAASESWKSEELLGKHLGKFNIKNDKEYVESLNLGSSKQAPRYFIESTLGKYGKVVNSYFYKK